MAAIAAPLVQEEGSGLSGDQEERSLKEAEGGGPGLPSSLAAAVTASQQESKEAWSAEDHPSGDRVGSKETADAAGDLAQVEGAGGGGGSRARNS